MKQNFTCFFIALFSTGVAFAQTFAGYYGTTQASSIKQTADQGFIIAGYIATSGIGGNDMYLIKTDVNGKVLWRKAYGGSGDDEATAIQITSDGGYIIAGFTNSVGFTAGGYDMYLVKTNSNGDTLWNRTYGGTADEQATSVQQTADGGYIIAGYTYSYGGKNGFADGYLVKTNANGDTLWTRVFGGLAGDEKINSVWQCSDKGYLLAGYTKSFPSSATTRMLVLKTDSSGVISGGIAPTFQKYFGSSVDDEATSAQQTTDGGFIVGGFTKASTGASQYTRGAGYDIALVKLTNSSTPAISFQYHYGGQAVLNGSSDDFGYSVQQTSDHGYIIAGSSYVDLSVFYREMYLVKTDSNGIGGGSNNPLYPPVGITSWALAYGIYGNGDDHCYSAMQTKSGGYVLAGDNSGSRIFVCKVDSAGGNCDISSFPHYEQGPLTWTLATPVTELFKGGGIVGKPLTKIASLTSAPTFDCTSNITLLPHADFTCSDSTICEELNNCIDFFDHSTSPTSWHWYFPGAVPDTSNQQNPSHICYSQPGTYPVTLVVSNSAGTDSLRASPLIIVGQTPSAPTVHASGDTVFSTHAYSYQWYFNGNSIPGATDSFYVAKNSGTYAVKIADSIGCSRFSSGINMTITGVNDLSENKSEGFQIHVFPNPSSGTFELQILSNKFNEFQIELQNAVGEVLYSDKIKCMNGANNIFFKHIAEGIYLLKISDQDGFKMMKVFIRK